MTAGRHAVTLHQPWASLVALGVKTIETRSWSTKYRGPLLIHAGRTYNREAAEPNMALRQTLRHRPLPSNGIDIPLGAIVASCTLADVVPIAHLSDYPEVPTLDVDFERLTMFRGEQDGRGRHQGSTGASDQFPYGDFTPGRFAWLLEHVKPTTERCPACWGSGWWAPEGCRSVPDSYDRCPTCDGKGSCDPIPAKGKQRLWGWNT